MSVKDYTSILNFENQISQLTKKHQEHLQELIDMQKKELLLTKHKYKISHLEGADHRWQTYVKADTKTGRKVIKKNTERELIDYLLDFYELRTTKTFSELFNEWMEYKKTITGTQKTIRRHQQHFNKYFVTPNSSLLKKDISKIDKLSLQSVCNQLVKNFNLSKHEWANVKTILNGMYDLAFEKGYIKANLMQQIKITVPFRQITKKQSKDQVFLADEYSLLHDYFNNSFEELQNVAYLAAKLQSYTGMRVGEVIALRWEDIDFDAKAVYVRRQYISRDYQDETGKWHSHYEIVEHTKTHEERHISLIPQAIDLLNKLPAASTGYIFTRNGHLITINSVEHVMRRFAKMYDLAKTKRTHALRRTYASRCLEAGVSLEDIRIDLGHTNLLTTERYIFSTIPQEITYNLKASAV